MSTIAVPPPLFAPELGDSVQGGNLAELEAELESELQVQPSTQNPQRQAQSAVTTGWGRAGVISVGRSTVTSGTVADALEAIRELMLEQIESAKDQGTNPNEVAFGDSAVRVTFYTVLPYKQQRTLFLEIASKSSAWPRIRGLFGAPPYQFLGPEDASALRAAGIASRRTNMGYSEVQSASNYSQFGSGHYADEYEREYRVLPRANANVSDPLPWLLKEIGTNELQLEVRVKKRDKKQKLELLKDRNGKVMLTFPRPGDQIQLTETPRLLRIQNKRAQDAARTLLRVRRVVPRGERSATAAILGTVM